MIVNGALKQTALLGALVWAVLGFVVPGLALELQITGTRQAGTGAEKILSVEFQYRDATGVTAAITATASADNGATWVVPVQTVSGNTAITATTDWQNGTIAWAAGQDWHNQYSAQMKVKLVADDGRIPLVVQSISLTPATTTKAPGEAQTYTVTVTYRDSRQADVSTGVTLTAAPAGQVTIAGLTVTANSDATAGDVTITASYSGQTATATLTVSAGTSPAAEFVHIPAGTNNGTNPLGAGEAYDSVWYPATYNLTVSAFSMGKYEVTRALWDEVYVWAINNGYTDLDAGAGKGPTHPVHSVTWYDIVKWCNARSEKDGRTPCYTVSGSVYKTGNSNDVACNSAVNGYRLPTDTEWEYAARGGLGGNRFPWGDTITHDQADYCGNPQVYDYDVGYEGYDTQYYDGVEPYTSPVGTFATNGYGLYDMTGNVCEWNGDWYPGYAGVARVIRGGGWYDEADFCRVGRRDIYWPETPHYDIGFRLVLTAGQ